MMVKFLSIKVLVAITAFILIYSCAPQDEIQPFGSEDGDTIKITGLEETPLSALMGVGVASPQDFGTIRGDFQEKFSLYMPPIRSQGREGSCVAWAVGYSAMSQQFHQGSQYRAAHVFSPEYIYNQIKVGGCDGGSYFVSNSRGVGALDLVISQGACSWESMPYDDDGCDQQPNSQQRTEAENYRVERYHRVSDHSEIGIKTLVGSGYPVIIGADLDQQFYQADRDFVWRSWDGNFRGKHAMVVAGWDDSKQAFKVQNSWGTSWGDQGWLWIDYQFFADVVFEAYIMEISNQDQQPNISFVPWDVYISYATRTEPNEKLEDVIKDGIAWVESSLVEQPSQQYWTAFELDMPSQVRLDANRSSLRIRTRNNYGRGGKPAFDISLTVIGTNEEYTVNFVESTWARSHTVLGTGRDKKTNLDDLVQNLSSWTDLEVAARDGKIIAYYDQRAVAEVTYSGNLGEIKAIKLVGKGSFQVDEVWLYEKDELRIRENFDLEGRSNPTWIQ